MLKAGAQVFFACAMTNNEVERELERCPEVAGQAAGSPSAAGRLGCQEDALTL